MPQLHASARQCGPPAAKISSNAQLVSHIRCGASSLTCYDFACEVPSRAWPAQLQRARHRTTICSAAVPSAIPVEFHNATEARLYALFDFVHEKARLPEVQEQHKGVAVGQWAEQCRQQHQAQQLEQQLIDALQTVPGWHWQPAARSSSFQDNLQLLQHYQLQNEGRLPKMRANKRTADATQNGQNDEAAATAVCRQLMEARKRGVLTQQQVHHIAAALPGWKWDNRIRAPPLDALIAHLQEFTAEHGRLPKQHEKLADGFLIGEWISMRRSEYSKGQLETDVAAMIESGVPGWYWNLVDTAFEQNLEVLKSFVAQHRRMPSQREVHEGVRIGAWCNKRRLMHKQGGLAADKVAALEAVDGWWWSADEMPQ